ncbi:MAG: glycosyltransferase [Planctomycetes bacterium]|nr:glycosyltransferase [Planctomycetota bacterium]MCC7172687.1 glycosyltransferase [Planctomycetota bacterium]
MIVAVDVSPALKHAPGVGRYARELTRALVRRADAPALRLLEVGRAPHVLPVTALGLDAARASGVDVRVTRVSLPRRVVGALGRVGWTTERWVGGADVVHQVLPYEPLPTRTALSTLTLSELPEPRSADEPTLRTTLLRTERALVFSTSARDELTRRYDVDASWIDVVPVGADHWARETTATHERRSPPEVLVLGQASSSRRPDAIVAACERVVAAGLELRLRFVGPKGDLGDALRARLLRSALAGRATIEPGVEAEMPGLVAGAGVLVHLNDVEWTAVTPLEALAVGVPVVVSRIPAFVEALGDEAGYVDDDAELADAIAAAITTDSPATRMRRRDLARSFTWDRNAAATIDVWTRMVSARDSGPTSS